LLNANGNATDAAISAASPLALSAGDNVRETGRSTTGIYYTRVTTV
jgi:hypothetical protein